MANNPYDINRDWVEGAYGSPEYMASLNQAMPYYDPEYLAQLRQGARQTLNLGEMTRLGYGWGREKPSPYINPNYGLTETPGWAKVTERGWYSPSSRLPEQQRSLYTGAPQSLEELQYIQNLYQTQGRLPTPEESAKGMAGTLHPTYFENISGQYGGELAGGGYGAMPVSQKSLYPTGYEPRGATFQPKPKLSIEQFITQVDPSSYRTDLYNFLKRQPEARNMKEDDVFEQLEKEINALKSGQISAGVLPFMQALYEKNYIKPYQRQTEAEQKEWWETQRGLSLARQPSTEGVIPSKIYPTAQEQASLDYQSSYDSWTKALQTTESGRIWLQQNYPALISEWLTYGSGQKFMDWVRLRLQGQIPEPAGVNQGRYAPPVNYAR